MLKVTGEEDIICGSRENNKTKNSTFLFLFFFFFLFLSSKFQTAIFLFSIQYFHYIYTAVHGNTVQLIDPDTKKCVYIIFEFEFVV